MMQVHPSAIDHGRAAADSPACQMFQQDTQQGFPTNRSSVLSSILVLSSPVLLLIVLLVIIPLLIG